MMTSSSVVFGWQLETAATRPLLFVAAQHSFFDVVRVVVTSVDDQQVLDPPGDEQLTAEHHTEISGTQPGALRCAERRIGQLRTEHLLG